MDIKVAMFIATVASLYINIAVCIYGMISRPNLVKKFISLTILQDSVNLFLILGGYRLWRGVLIQPPVLLNWSPSREDLEQFMMRAVDPLPQALVLTAIVIGLAANVFLASLILHLYRHFGTVDVDEIEKLKRSAIVEELS